VDPTDNFGIVAFDDTVQIDSPAGLLTDKQVLRRAIAPIDAGGSTDLSSGYVRSLQEARRLCGATGGTVLIVSDGHAN
jgi:Ca-activated chloride channel family protein